MIRDVTGKPAMRMSFRTVMLRATAGACLALLCACQSDRVEVAEENDVYDDTFQISNIAGILQTVPDEFSVVTKRPLEMPGSFAALPPPEPGKVSSRDPNPLADARAALAFEPVPASTRAGTPSAVEAEILSAAGAVDPAIRATLASEQAQYDAEQEQYLLDRIFPRLRRLRGDVDPDAINAEAERVRLLQAGITPRPTGTVAPIPAIPAPAQPALIPGPALPAPPPSGVPTLGVIVPEPVEAVPSLIYLPE